MPDSRRGFLKTLNYLIGSAVGVAVAIPGLRYLLYPTTARTVESPNDPIRVASADAITAVPKRVAIVMKSQRDAWANTPNVAIGAAWLVRGADGQIKALSTACPHLGCAVDFDDAAGEFRCPCHKSRYDKDGSRIEGPAKRGMDPLPTTVDADGQVLVQFMRFKPDTPDREKA